MLFTSNIEEKVLLEKVLLEQVSWCQKARDKVYWTHDSVGYAEDVIQGSVAMRGLDDYFPSIESAYEHYSLSTAT